MRKTRTSLSGAVIGGIIGGIWGVMSFFIFLMGGDAPSRVIEWWEYIVCAPLFLGMAVIGKTWPNADPIVVAVILGIIIGALIGHFVSEKKK